MNEKKVDLFITKDILLYETPVDFESRRKFSYQYPIDFVKGNFITDPGTDYLQTNIFYQFEIPLDIIYLPVVFSDPGKDEVRLNFYSSGHYVEILLDSNLVFKKINSRPSSQYLEYMGEVTPQFSYFQLYTKQKQMIHENLKKSEFVSV